MTNFLPILTGAVPGDYVGAINGVIQGINTRISDGTFGGGGGLSTGKIHFQLGQGE